MARRRGRPKRGSWWNHTPASRGGRRPYTTTPYKLYLWNGRYPYGCPGGYRRGNYVSGGIARGNSRHHGVDVGNVTGMRIWAWMDGYVVSGGYDRYGYRRWIQVYYPRANVTVTHGHLLNGSQIRVGARVRRNSYLAKIGTRYDGINHPHDHIRAAWGRWVRPIPACSDIPPLRAWRACGMPA